MEIWKNIKGYENLYEASNWGRIRSMRFGKIRILKPVKRKDGYLQVGLYKDGNGKWFKIHRLVWETFNGEIPEGYEVNHINEITTDNRLSNLNLLTHSQNVNFGTRNQRIKEKRSQAVLQLTYPGLEFIREWFSTHEAGRNGFNQSAVSECCNGKRKSHKGVTFRYK